MYVCPACKRGFQDEDMLKKHFLSCWKEQHPNHVSNEAPHSAAIETRNVTDDIMNFFNSFK